MRSSAVLLTSIKWASINAIHSSSYTSSSVNQISEKYNISFTYHSNIIRLFSTININVLAEKIDQISFDQQKHDHIMKMISNSENSLSFQSFSENEQNVVNDESSLNFTDFELSLKINSNLFIDEQVSESQDIDNTFTVDEKLNNQND